VGGVGGGGGGGGAFNNPGRERNRVGFLTEEKYPASKANEAALPPTGEEKKKLAWRSRGPTSSQLEPGGQILPATLRDSTSVGQRKQCLPRVVFHPWPDLKKTNKKRRMSKNRERGNVEPVASGGIPEEPEKPR